MSTQAVYATIRRTGTIKVGNNLIKLRHVVSSNMAYAGTPVGMAIAALRYLGKKQVTADVIENPAYPNVLLRYGRQNS